MPRAKTPSFTVEMPLVTNSDSRHTLDSRFEAGRQIYNACLGEAVRRHGQMVRSSNSCAKVSRTGKRKMPWPKGKLGLDLGPFTVAVVGDHSAGLDLFCRELDNVQDEIRRLQRRMDRQRRANNPDNFNPDGTITKGKKKWKDSRCYVHTRSKLCKLYRRQAAHRKSLHGKMINDILRQGNKIFLEEMSYKAWQRIFGKSVGYRGPGMFVSGLKRKAVTGNGEMQRVSDSSCSIPNV